jgi:putative flavoprotein involved in K+ transport
MRRVTTVIIGAGHAGLAMSQCLTERGVDHVVLERGEVANSWRTERWDSLRLLTPNWQSRLPGFAYDGDDPDGFRTMPEVVELIAGYARAIAAPVWTQTRVMAVRRTDAGYLVRTDWGDWHGRTLVIATGACNIPCVPGLAEALPSAIHTLTPMDYRDPDQLEEGGVLVVGASATGVQLADEIHRSGRPVILAVASTSAHPGRIGAGTSSGGWTPPACSTSATTRSTTSPGPARSPRSSSSARPSGRHWISMP